MLNNSVVGRARGSTAKISSPMSDASNSTNILNFTGRLELPGSQGAIHTQNEGTNYEYGSIAEVKNK